MTTPDIPETPRDDDATPQGGSEETTGGAAHSAPRPTPPIDVPDRPVPPLPPTRPTPPVAPTGADEDDPARTAPARVSAFGTTTPSSSTTPTGPGRTVPSAPIVPTVAPEEAATTTESTTPATPEPPIAPTSPLPVEPGSTTTTRVVPPGATVPLATPETLAGSTGGALGTEKAAAPVEREAPQEEGWVPISTSRTAAHIWGVVITLLAVPVAWFLLTDGALRTWWSLAPVDSRVNPAGLLSLAGGIIALVVIALVARASSLGAWIWGGVVTLAGLGALIVPGRAAAWLEQILPTLTSIHDGFGQNLHDYLLDTGRSGLMLVFGIVVLLFAIVSHTSRRSGRIEGRIKAERAAAGL